MLIPKKQEGNKSERKWFKAEKIKKVARKKSLSQKEKELIDKNTKGKVKETIVSYACNKCKKSFNTGHLRKQFIEAARNGQSFVSCPTCGVALVVDRTIKVATVPNTKINRNADLTVTYPNQGIVPSYVPQTWVDRAILEKVAHTLGKFAESNGMFNPQLKFQRGIRGKVREGAPENVKFAEYTIESVDDKDLRFRVVAVAGITPAGEVVLPKVFSTLDGREIPFTKEAIQEFVSGKVFGGPEPIPAAPKVYHRERDFTRFREIVAKKKTAEEIYEVKDLVEITYGNRVGEIGEIVEMKPEEDLYIIEFKDGVDIGFPKDSFKKLSKKKTAAGTPTPGQKVEYQGKMYTIDTTMGDASILRDETGMQTALIPHTDMNVQVEPGTLTAPTAPTAAVADKIEKLVKKSLRDEKTLFPFTDPDPDYSVAKQTDVDADFSIPYEKSDQGILPEEDRAVQKMFRGGSSIKPTNKTAAGELPPLNSPIYEHNMEEEYATITFPDLKVDMKRLEEFGGPEYYPKDEFIVYKNVEGKFTSNYTEADKSFEGDTIEDVAIQIKDFLNGDEVISYIGRPKINIKKKSASIKKVAEPTGYHETDETGKQISIDRLRQLVEDYVRAGQIPLDFDITKITSEVSRMTRKELEEIIDKKLKNQHYPVVHAKKDGLEKIARLQLFPVKEDALRNAKELGQLCEGERHFIVVPIILNENDIDTFGASVFEGETIPGQTYFVVAENVEEVKSWGLKSRILASKKTADKNIFEGTIVKTLGGLSGVVMEIIPDYKFRTGVVGTGYKVSLDDERQIVYTLADLEKVVPKIALKGKSTNEIVLEMRKKADFSEEMVQEHIKEEEEGAEMYNDMAKEVECPKAEKALNDMAEDEAEHAEKLEEVVLPAVEYEPEEKEASKKSNVEDVVKIYVEPNVTVDARGSEDDIENIEGVEEEAEEKETEKEASLRFAQEVDVKEKPKTELKELKTKPHGKLSPEEVKEAPVATSEMQKVFNDVQSHKQRLTEIQSIVDDARRKVEEQIRAIQEEHGSVTEASQLQEGIEKLASLVENAQTQVVDFGELLAYLDTSIKEKKFKPSDRWKVDKLLEKFGEEAKTYLERAEKGSQSLNEEIQQRILTIFPKRESSIEKESNVLDSIKELGSGLLNYIKSLKEIVEQGEQLELAL